MNQQTKTSARLSLVDRAGRTVGVLEISCRPSQIQWNGIDSIIDREGSPDLGGASPVQLLEDVEYLYQVEGITGDIRIEPRELFDADNESQIAGRLRPGRRTGTVLVEVRHTDGSSLARCGIEVRSRKLGYLAEYRWMLGRIADEATEALMQRFGASHVTLRPIHDGSPETTYQRFALLKALLESDVLVGAISLITHRPHAEYRIESESTDPARGLRSGRQAARVLVSPGPRIRATVAHLSTVPREIDRAVHVETLDTIPNRFVKHALEQWLGVVYDVRGALRDGQTASDRRGLREADDLERFLSSQLNGAMFREVGAITSFPTANEVLQRREGYRELFRSYLMMEVASALDWSGGDDVFRAGQRDVAALYEYWVFLELARVVSTVIGQPLDTSALFEVERNGLSLNLSRGTQAVVSGTVSRRNRRFKLDLYFNRQFNHGKHSSWTADVRPDCSLRLCEEGSPDSPTWLHFDAKYRLHELKQVLMEPISGEEDDGYFGTSSAVKNDDLLKMHAYRDAVRRTAGAYVLYPGNDDQAEKRFSKYHEVLPGLGAFALRPTSGGQGAVSGVTALARFLSDVLDHVASQGTSRERADFWESKSYEAWRADSYALERRLNPVSFLEVPADDTLVILAFAKSEEHRQWILSEGMYNIRADEDRRGSIGLDSDELRASFLVLYNPAWEDATLFWVGGAMHIRSRDELITSGYPEPGGERYLCLDVGPMGSDLLSGPAVSAAARENRVPGLWAAPRALPWSELQSRIAMQE